MVAAVRTRGDTGCFFDIPPLPEVIKTLLFLLAWLKEEERRREEASR